MRPIKRSIIWILIVASSLSCVTNKTLIESDPINPFLNYEEINNKVKVGDLINIKVNNRTYENLTIVEMNDASMTIKQYYGQSFKLHIINLKFVQALEIVEIEQVYPVGVPVTLLLVIFYLIV